MRQVPYHRLSDLVQGNQRTNKNRLVSFSKDLSRTTDASKKEIPFHANKMISNEKTARRCRETVARGVAARVWCVVAQKRAACCSCQAR